MSTQTKHTIEPVAHSNAWRVLRDGETLITTHATDGARQIATEIAVALDGTTIPTPLRRHLDAERRELLNEAGAMAHALENIARALRKAGNGTSLAEVTWHMESLVTQGLTAKALARSASDLARLESLTGALDNATAGALAAAETVASFVQLAYMTTPDGASWRLIHNADGHHVESISARSLERGLAWAYICTIEEKFTERDALTLLEATVESIQKSPNARPFGAKPSGKLGEVV